MTGQVIARIEGVETVRCEACSATADGAPVGERARAAWRNLRSRAPVVGDARRGREGLQAPLLHRGSEVVEADAYGIATSHKVYAFYDVLDGATAGRKPKPLPTTVLGWIMSPITISFDSFRPVNPTAYSFTQTVTHILRNGTLSLACERHDAKRGPDYEVDDTSYFAPSHLGVSHSVCVCGIDPLDVPRAPTAHSNLNANANTDPVSPTAASLSHSPCSHPTTPFPTTPPEPRDAVRRPAPSAPLWLRRHGGRAQGTDEAADDRAVRPAEGEEGDLPREV